MKPPYVFDSIAALYKVLGLPKPMHPLVSITNYKDITADTSEISQSMVLNLYKVSYKKYFTGKVKYGQQHYDFDEGGLSFIAPNQVIAEDGAGGNYEGLTLLIHPDFLRTYPLGKTIKNYGFFSYAANEALHLSAQERKTIINVMESIEEELHHPIDHYSQDVIVSYIELLLNYSNRFYNRQFITRKSANHDLLIQLETILSDYFNQEKGLTHGLPTVQYLSDRLNVSPRYLSDMLRSLTGQNAQQHIHNKLIDKAKEILGATRLSVSEIAYLLGFEHPQSFSKIFRRKTNTSPGAFRQSLS
ncbi:AraC family transcriptional regulator [uncultured Chitinophaga sp.]|uniref:helix-turn-helix domain-containing protein n=1 Tax=uncultured Chitinophaga sp. TaxID=339340 RepID=UPI0025E3FF19|nr:helix-turn-helix domain-containing protein [uncultured Chitinophaga sp.]